MCIKVEMQQGAHLLITFEGKEGYVVVDFDSNDSQKLTIFSEMADDEGRRGLIYSSLLKSESEGPQKLENSEQVVAKLVCINCGEEFELTLGEEQYLKEVFKEYYNPPKRCCRCRKIKQKQK